MPEKNQLQDSKVTEAQSPKIRYGAPDGPRQKRRERYDEPLAYAGHEAVAQFLAAPTSEREFKSLTSLANDFSVTRTTVHRWARDFDVLKRANWLSIRNQMAGDLLASRDWMLIMKKAVQMAKNGDLNAMKFCASRTCAKNPQGEQSEFSATVSFEDLVGTNDGDDAEEIHDNNRHAEGGDQ